MTKKELIIMIEEMREPFSTDNVIINLMLIDKIEKAREEIKEGKNVNTEKARKKMSKHLKKD